MVSDITAMMTAGSRMTSPEASAGTQQADGYRDLYRDAMKKLQNSEKRDGKNSGDKADNGVEKPVKQDAAEEDDGRQTEVKPEGSLFMNFTAGAEWQSVLWMQTMTTQDAEAVPGEQELISVVPEPVQTAAGLTPDNALNGKAAESKGEIPADNTAIGIPEAEQPVENTEKAGNPEIQVLQSSKEAKQETAAGTVEKDKQPVMSGKQKLSDETQKGNPEVYVQPEIISSKTPGFVNAAGTAEKDAAAAGQNTPAEQFQKLPEEILTRISAGEREFSVQLEPESLGKLVIKASYMEGKATVSIICTNEKTLELLSGRAREIGSILENSMGTPTNVVLDKTETNYLEQNRNGQNGQNGQQNQPEEDRRKKQEKKGAGIDFLHQLRLGLV